MQLGRKVKQLVHPHSVWTRWLRPLNKGPALNVELPPTTKETTVCDQKLPTKLPVIILPCIPGRVLSNWMDGSFGQRTSSDGPIVTGKGRRTGVRFDPWNRTSPAGTQQ